MVRDCMTSPVFAVHPDDRASKVAQLLLDHKISGLPVVDEEGAPLGVVSEADFIRGDERQKEQKREAWVNLLTGGQGLSADYLEAMEASLGAVRQVMRAPAICVDEATPLDEAAQKISQFQIKRLPVTRGGRVVGIITRADLLRAIANRPAEALPKVESPPPILPLAAKRAKAPTPDVPKASTQNVAVDAENFRELVAAHERDLEESHRNADRAARERLLDEVDSLLRATLSEGEWLAILEKARRAAADGAGECVIMQFPALLCTDGGRAVNLPDPDWPATLRGKAALLFLRWREELRPRGFKLSARMGSFRGGLPGDVEISLVWGR